MADTAAHTNFTSRPNAGRDSFPIADGVTLYYGTLVQIQAGYLNHFDDSGEPFIGIFVGGEDRAYDGVYLGETDDTPDPRGFVDTSGLILTHLASIADTPSAAKVGDLVYSISSNITDITLESSGATDPIGVLWNFVSTTDCDVKLFSAGEMMAQQTA